MAETEIRKHPGFSIWEETEAEDIAVNVYDPSKLPKKYLIETPNMELITSDLKKGEKIPGAESTAVKIKMLRVK